MRSINSVQVEKPARKSPGESTQDRANRSCIRDVIRVCEITRAKRLSRLPPIPPTKEDNRRAWLIRQFKKHWRTDWADSCNSGHSDAASDSDDDIDIITCPVPEPAHLLQPKLEGILFIKSVVARIRAESRLALFAACSSGIQRKHDAFWLREERKLDFIKLQTGYSRPLPVPGIIITPPTPPVKVVEIPVVPEPSSSSMICHDAKDYLLDLSSGIPIFSYGQFSELADKSLFNSTKIDSLMNLRDQENLTFQRGVSYDTTTIGLGYGSRSGPFSAPLFVGYEPKPRLCESLNEYGFIPEVLPVETRCDHCLSLLEANSVKTLTNFNPSPTPFGRWVERPGRGSYFEYLVLNSEDTSYSSSLSVYTMGFPRLGTGFQCNPDYQNFVPELLDAVTQSLNILFRDCTECDCI